MFAWFGSDRRQREPGEAGTATGRLPWIAYALVAGSIAAALVVLAVTGLTLVQARRATWDQARRSAENLLAVVANDIRRNVELYDASLRGMRAALDDPEVARLPGNLRRLVLFDSSTASDYFGSVLVLDEKGAIVVDSGSEVPRAGNFADRDYFRVHVERADVGLYVSRPYFSRLRGGDASIAFSRRIDRPDGGFGGIVMGAMRLAYFRDLFSTLDVGRDGFVVLMNANGSLLMRRSIADGDEAIGRDVSRSPVFKRILVEERGSVIGHSIIDGVERFYVFERIPGTPLIVNVAQSVEEVLGEWRQRSIVFGLVAVCVGLGFVGFAVALLHEFRRRHAAEADLALLAVTDPLTNLANRRRFDEVVGREWRRTARTGSSLGLLMIDADRFKALNDRYGHAHGDEVLRRIARVIDEAMRRPGDVGFRYGGEEFACVLPDIDVLGAMRVAETIRQRLEAQDDAASAVTVSIGVAWIHAPAGGSVEDFVAAADEALYRAKRSGRNRVVLTSVGS